MPKHRDLALIFFAAIVASGLFLIIFGIGLGFVFVFLPTLPIFAIGLSRYSRLAWATTGLACLLVGGVAGPEPALLFIGFLGAPAAYLATKSLLHIPLGNDSVWAPLGTLLSRLAFCACALIALVTLCYATTPGGLPHLLSQNIHEAFAALQEDYNEIIEIIDALASRWSFLIFSVTIWLWGLSLFAHGWLANRLLELKGWNIRPDFAITAFILPKWLPSLLAICALASLIGGPSLSFLGKTMLISLLLPYFFQGAALMHLASKTWPSRRFFLFFIYFMVFAQFWPALIIAGIGLWHQIKHLSGSGGWFKS